jgi:hypothetical protein
VMAAQEGQVLEARRTLVRRPVLDVMQCRSVKRRRSVDVDRWRAGMSLPGPARTFDRVVFRVVSLDHSGKCSMSSWRVGAFGDLVDGAFDCDSEALRGKSPPGQ